MRFKITYILFLLFFAFSFNNTKSQEFNKQDLNFAKQQLENRQEFYFSFKFTEKDVVQELSNTLSIDAVVDNTAYAYANPEQFEHFLSYNIAFEPVYSYYDISRNIVMANTLEQMSNWDRYPTFAVYEEMMLNFVSEYPNMTRLDTIGFSVNSYPILCIVISADIDSLDNKPKFWWSGTMHGDELVSYVLLLRLADYFLSSYGVDSQVTNLLDNAVIYIDPLANPDGTFYDSPDYTDVSQSRRTNANNFDLNRNYPALHGNSQDLQIEAQIAMDYAAQEGFTMSANVHSGAECINYPWDHWTSSARKTADDEWWQYVSWIYADNAHQNSPDGYFGTRGGVTNGGDWYVITGSRQDFMNYHRNIREVTLEWSNQKRLNVNELDNHWNYNKQAILDYTEQILYGVRGFVKDACSGEPIIGAKIEIKNHDKDNSEVYSFAPLGYYHRLIYQGSYEMTVSADGYYDLDIDFSINNNEIKTIDIELVPNNIPYPNFEADNTEIFAGDTVIFTNTTQNNPDEYNWYFYGGTPDFYESEDPPPIVYNEPGEYDVVLTIKSSSCEASKSMDDYIKVYPREATVTNFIADNTNLSAGESIQFLDLSENIPKSWDWYFEGGNPEYSSEQNPIVEYSNPGTYTVSLLTRNNYGQNEKIKEDYIIVGVPEACHADSDNTEYMYISNFSLNTIDNNSDNSRYSDFTHISTDLMQGQSYTFSITNGNSYSYDQCIIWIDWNGNGSFEDDGDEVYRSETGNHDVFTGEIQIPENAETGKVRLRIRLHYNRSGFSPNDTPCGTSGFGEVEDYSINIIEPEIPPLADFSAELLSVCSGEVQFTDKSSLAEEWRWDFGDGNISTEQNPVHTYTTSGVYTVELKVSNEFGENTKNISDFIEITIPERPLATNDTACGPAYLNLYADAAGTIKWYENQDDLTPVNTGNQLMDYFENSTIFYLESVININESKFGGKYDNVGIGDYFSGDAEHGLKFNAETDFVLKSVKLYAMSDQERTINLLNAQDSVIATKTTNIPEGESRVELNFFVPADTAYTITASENVNLYRNGEIGAPQLEYPFTIDSILSIYSNTAEGITDHYLSFYYYFYDWEISVEHVCVSDRSEIKAVIFNLPEIDLGDDIQECRSEGEILLDAGEGFSEYNWNNDSANTQIIQVSNTGVYFVVVTDTNNCEAIDSIRVNIFENPIVSISETHESYPGANDGSAVAHVSSGSEPYYYLWSNDSTGQSISNLSQGEYFLTVNDGNNCYAFDSVVISVMTFIDDELSDNILIYPNPFSETVVIESQKTIKSIELFDINSSLIYRSDNNSKSYTFNMTDKPSGTYFLRIKTKDYIIKRKIIKL